MYDYVPTLAIGDSGNIYLLHNGVGHYGFLPILVRYDSLMNEQWSQAIGTYYGCYQFATDISIDESENIYVGGAIGNNYCHDDSVYFLGQLAYVGHNGIPAVCKFSSDGDLDWIKKGEAADFDGINALCRSSTGNFYAVGSFGSPSGDGDTLVFDGTTILNDGNWGQLFVAKLDIWDETATAVPEMAGSEQIEIFPNPSQGIFTLKFADTPKGTGISVCDILGNCIWKKNCNGKICQDIDLGDPPKGVYFVEVFSAKARSTHKIIVQ
jgi:hypothetical protein